MVNGSNGALIGFTNGWKEGVTGGSSGNVEAIISFVS